MVRRCLLNTNPDNERASVSEELTVSPAPAESCAQDDLPEEDERGSLRRCVVTRERGTPDSMLRFVVGPDRVIVPDLSARLPGRGIWLSARRDVLDNAQNRGVFSRAARQQVTVPSDLPEQIAAGLIRRISDVLGLARRAGQSVCGFMKVREWIVAHQAGIIVQASDGSPDECVRLLSGARDLPVVSPLTAEKLGHIFGREHVVHAALRKGALASRLQQECERFAGVAGLAAPRASAVSGDRVEQADR